MSEPAEKLMTVDEFLVWAEGREGKWELHDGRPVEKNTAMAPERSRHGLVKSFAGATFVNATRRLAGPCRTYIDSLAVRVAQRTYIPDIVVVCSEIEDHETATSTPIVVVEVLSPSTAAFDHGAKLEGYFSLPSLAHYLIVDPDRQAAILHSRGREGVIETRILHEGEVRLDPPGLAFELSELFA
jgi:Uma2 family endonuclease